MRIAIVILLVLFLGSSSGAVYAGRHDDGRIVPGERIGRARLGMSEGDIDAINSEANCPVDASYDLSGAVMRLVTEWGGGCRVSGDIQVGLSFGRAAEALGRPDEVSEDARYPFVTAYWVTYSSWGIAFRVLVIEGRFTIIQAIAIFRGTAQVTSRLKPMQSEPWK